MKQDASGPTQSLTGRMVAAAAALTLLAGGVLGSSIIREALVTGKTYSPAVVLGLTKFYYRSSSPMAYWCFIGFYMCSIAVCLVLGALTLREALMRNKSGRNSSGNQ